MKAVAYVPKQVGKRLFLLASGIVLAGCATMRLEAQPSSGLFAARAAFNATNHLVSISLFQWFSANGGQLSGPWQPLEGRTNWTGTTNFWRNQIKEIMAADIDVLYVHLIPSSEEQRTNLFQTLNQLRREGWNVPKVAPFLDPMITWNQLPLVDVSTATGKDTFVGQYIRFFNQYYSVNQDAYADDYLARINGRVVLDTWHVKFNLTNLNSLTRADVETRLQAAFGAAHPVFTNGIRMITTALNDPTLSFADEKVPQFEINTYYYPVQWAGIQSAQLKGGYWDQNIRNPGDWLPRNGGRPFTNAWNQAVQARLTLKRVYLESWNEYDEGTGMFAANPGPPYILPGSGNTNTDLWSISGDPYEYIKTTARGAALFNDWSNHAAAIVWHNIPTQMQPGETRSATVIVRNEGDALWNEATQFRFSQWDTDTVNFGHGRYLIDDSQDDIPTFGGIFRGRPKIFQLTLTAPMQPGVYATHWGMLQENVEWFGEEILQDIQVGVGAIASASPTNGSAPLTIQFTGQGTGGKSATPIDTTDDHQGTVTAAGENNGINGYWEVATNAFDNTTGTKWLDFANNYPNTRQSWIQYQYANGQRNTVTEYTITSANDAARYPERNPADWRLLGSNNGGVSWVTLDIQTNQVFTQNFQKLSYVFTNTTPYNIYRFQIDRVANPALAVGMQLDELEFLVLPNVYSYFWDFGDGATSTNQNPQHTYLSNGNYNATLVISDGVSSATNTAAVELAQPTLFISWSGPGALTLTWPAWATGFSLYSTTNLSPPVAWLLDTNPIIISGSNNIVTLPMDSNGERFFQLRRAVNIIGRVVVGSVRVQLLSDSLVRLEVRGPEGFEDRSTFHVVSRDFPGVAFTTNVVSGEMIVAASDYVVHVPVAAASLSGVHVDSPLGQVLYAYQGLLTNSAWLPGPSENPGAWSFADTPRLIAPAWGVTPAPPGANNADNSGWDVSNDSADVYVFVPQGNYRRLRSDFIKLTGPTEMVPLYALGAFDSRWYDYSETTALQQIDDYRAHRIPLDVLVNDAGWRAQEYVYQSNPSSFPNLARYFQEAHARNVRIQFNDHPQPVNASLPALDASEVQFRADGLATILNQGLDIWWYDRNWSVALASPVNLRKEVWGMREYHDLTRRAKPGLRPLIMANVDGIDNGIRNRPPDVAAHRYPFQWTGDIGPDFAFLQGALENCVYSGVQSLLPYMSSDLGGFVADPTVEGYIRWIQFGALSPIYRPHCTMSLSRMPWTFGPAAETVARRFLNLRYRLLPLFYTAARDNYETGEPLVRRLDLDYPQYAQARSNDEFLLGQNVLVAPVFRGTTLNIVPGAWLTTPSNQSGLQGDYFTNNTLTGSPTFTRTDLAVNFNWGTGSPNPSIPADYFSARWTGTIQVPAATGDVFLATLEDDGSRVWIENQLVIDAWGPHNSSTTEAQIPLTAGVPHALRIEYQEITGNAVIRLQWHPVTIPIAQSVWIPPGLWVDAYTGQAFTGPTTITNLCALDRTPIYFRSGGVIVEAPEMQFTGQRAWDPLTVDVYLRPDQTNQVMLYEDDGLTENYQHGQFRKTAISASTDGALRTARVEIGSVAGDYPLAPAQRSWTVRLHRPQDWPANQAPVQALLNGPNERPISRLVRNETAMPLGAPNGAPDADVFEVPLPSAAVSTANTLEIAFDAAPNAWTSRDIGTVGFEGGSVISNQVAFVRGGGADIGGTSDNFHFMYQPLSGDAELIVHVLSQAPTDNAAKAGVMLRETLDPTAREAAVFVTPSSGLFFQWRAVAGGAGGSSGNLPGAAPYWLRLVRTGVSLSSYVSTNGITWTAVGAIDLTGLSALAYWGLAVTAHNNSSNSLAIFDQLNCNASPMLNLPPQISVLRTAFPGEIGLSWPSCDAQMTLWAATNLVPPILWWPAHDAILSTNGDSIRARMSITNATRFFRLSAVFP